MDTAKSSAQSKELEGKNKPTEESLDRDGAHSDHPSPDWTIFGVHNLIKRALDYWKEISPGCELLY